MKNNLGLFLSKRALLSPDREAYVESDGSLRLTFKELNLRCNQLANAFVEAGVENEFRITPEQLEAAITPKTKMVIL